MLIITTTHNNYRGVLRGSGTERLALAERRDLKIIEIVDHREVVDHRLIAAELDLPDTPSSRASIGRRLKRLAKIPYVQLVRQDNVTFAVTLDIPIRARQERRQLSHRYSQAKVWRCLEATLPIEQKKTDRQWRIEGGALIPDGSFVYDNIGYFIECNGGRDHFETKVFEKSQRYYENRDYLCSLLGVNAIQVLWISKLPGRVPRMVEAFSTIGTGGMFRVAAEKDINIFHPDSILSSVWWSPKDQRQHSLMGG